MASIVHLLGKPANEERTTESCRFKVLCSAIKAGNWIRFPAFTTGEHFWSIICLPHKDVKGEITRLSFNLRYLGEWKDINITVNSSVLKWNDVLSSIKGKTTTLTFGKCGSEYYYGKIEGDELNEFLKDDYIIVICNLTILSAACVETLDSGVTIIKSLAGKSRSHSLDNKNITSRETVCGSFQFKVISPNITEKESVYFYSPMFMVDEFCWFIQCCIEKHSYLTLRLLVQSEIKDLKVNLNFSVLTKDEQTSLVRKRNIIHTFNQCGEYIYLDKSVGGDELKQSLKDDHFIVVLNITILSETIKSGHDVTIISSRGKPRNPPINGPSPYLQDHLSQLLQNKERVDTTFDVNGELFHAHRLVLAARSTVFNAELFNPMNKNCTGHIKISEIEPRVFKAMLHFIYTDMLPNLNNSCNEENHLMDSIQMTRGLLIAADRYALERLKLICEAKLSKSIIMDDIVTTLILAEKHNCPNLKISCLEFLSQTGNLSKVALLNEFGQLAKSYPMIIKELGEKLQNMST